MKELRNIFSWSYSAAMDFEECRRRHYWKKYGKWGGWNRDADPTARKAYQLDKMENCFTLTGHAAEQAVEWLLAEAQSGRDHGAEEAWEHIARPFLRRAWKESRDGEWRRAPKKYCCLREHYYGTLEDEKSRAAEMKEQILRCLAHFLDRTLPRLRDIRPEDRIEVAVPGAGGDAEHFVFNGIKVYAIPDYAWREADRIHIIDWKAGRMKAEHARQVGVYGLWAREKHATPPEQVTVYVEYLNEGRVAVDQLTPERLDEVVAYMSRTVGEMTEYLVDADRERNIPVPRDEWELASDPRICGRCNFYELCREELER
ncbi:PD-(D/E)XK nuclease family protein [Kiritimatiella glycovorans]|uniref:PD-(D/E)XK nuclease superfamily protein n=1 Tax=Kiritimatiella glycovorans TaxID=1307763 RepID=A0A0G3EKF3_9BACT|nr:PD-(D/E)XK nuclease family protein [Kiritimatiella glycovorans]AKJ64654.1 PD-(D/E)XK nuclease superfamily protein [Kiritimatiella glycovorans]